MNNGKFKAKTEIAIHNALTKRFGDASLGDEEYEIGCILSILIPMVDDNIIEAAIAKYIEDYGFSYRQK